MALIEINLDPSNRDLKWFGVLAFVFFLLIGNFVYWATTATGIAYALWIGVAAIFSAPWLDHRACSFCDYFFWGVCFDQIGFAYFST